MRLVSNHMILLFTLLLCTVAAEINCAYFSSTKSPVCDVVTEKHDYCVVGAGAGGLQIARFLQEAKRDYIVFEKGEGAGTFFQTFPRHRKLISINKKYTGIIFFCALLGSGFNFHFNYNLFARYGEIRQTES
jgi:hypothetical protein